MNFSLLTNWKAGCTSILIIAALWLGAHTPILSSTAAASSAQAQTGERCFAETGYCISGRIREFWEQNGGLPVFGYPIAPQREERIEGQPYQVQWFERERLELHPENAPPYDVLLGRLGDDQLQQQGRRWQDFPTSEPQPGCRYFEQTRQNVCGDILAMWRASGLEFDGQPGTSEAESIALFGLPISPARTETVEGREYTVQWFERARFELHPENSPPYHVLLGLLGRSVLTGTGAPPPADERIVFSAPEPDGNRSISVVNADGSGLTKLTDGTSYDVFPSWSPDGSQIAFVSNRDGRQPGSESHQDVYVMNADGSNVRRLTDAKGRDICPAWSPDGSTIAFISAREQTGRPITYLMNSDGSNQRRLRAGESGCAKWSPDGSRLLFGYSEPGGSRLATIRPDGTGETLIASGQVGGPVWSPDGTQIAFDRHDGIVLVNADGSNDRFLTVGSFPDWSPNGERIAYTSYLSGQGQIYSIRQDGMHNVRLSNVGAPGYMPLWSPSSSQIAFLRGASGDTRIVVVNADGTREIEVASGTDPEWQP